MTLEPPDPDAKLDGLPAWAEAGWDWTGGGDDRLRIPRPAPGDYRLVSVDELKAVQAALAKANAQLEEKVEFEKSPLHKALETVLPELNVQKVAPGIMGKAFEKLSKDLLALQDKARTERTDMWLKLLRAFTIGAVVAWVARDLWG